MSTKRARARELAQAALGRGEPLAWFEELYQEALHAGTPIPWADLRPNPNLIDLTSRIAPLPQSGSALKVGCGLGDDSEWMASRGWETTAFDISPTAIAQCHQRFPVSSVAYVVADLFSAPQHWIGAFDVVVETYTLQVLPHESQQLGWAFCVEARIGTFAGGFSWGSLRFPWAATSGSSSLIQVITGYGFETKDAESVQRSGTQENETGEELGFGDSFPKFRIVGYAGLTE